MIRLHVIRWLTHPRMIWWLMPWLMLLLVVGTIAQREIGLYEAEQRYFTSWIVWLGPVPTPGLYPVLALLSLSLLAKLAFKSPWRAANAGSIITHFGALLLMAGGLLTALSAEEGFMPLAEGDRASRVSDYHQRELAVFKNDRYLFGYAPEALMQEAILPPESLPFTLEVTQFCRNCQPAFREEKDENVAYFDLADRLILQDAPLEKEDEGNLAGVMLRLSDATADSNGVYLAYEGMPRYPSWNIGDDQYRLEMRKTQRALPFSITLKQFEKMVHPGTNTAREYQSEVLVDEGGGIRWSRLIRMNEPLRVQGYTVYQSSFVQAGEETLSVLAVVKNHGRVFPYVASLVMAVGLLLQVAQRARKRRREDHA